MGTQGEIYVVYGLQVEAKVLYARGGYRNPVVYGVNGRAFSDDEDKMPVLGLDVKESDLGLHLMFDWLQGY